MRRDRAKRIRTVQQIPQGQFLIVPIGTYLNVALQEAGVGARFEVWQDWRHGEYEILQTTKMRINTPEFTFLMRHIYGRRFRIADLMKRFEDWSFEAGAGFEGFDRERCLVIELTEVKEEE